MKRRQFLKQTIGGAGVGAVVLAAAPIIFSIPFDANAEPDPLKSPNFELGLSTAHWETLAAIQAHMLPSEKNVPGAKEVNGLKFFHYVVTQPDINPEEKVFLINGVKSIVLLNDKLNQKAFAELNSDEREKTLRAFEDTDDGYYWLQSVLHYLLEALLGDPSYGGNPKGIAWEWLDIKPGFPRPLASNLPAPLNLSTSSTISTSSINVRTLNT